MFRLFSLIVLIMLPITNVMAYEASSVTTISKVHVYPDIDYTPDIDGDMIFSIEVPVSGCEGGFWVGGSEKGASQTMSFILSAFHAGSNVKVWGSPEKKWVGSSGAYCHVYTIEAYK